MANHPVAVAGGPVRLARPKLGEAALHRPPDSSSRRERRDHAVYCFFEKTSRHKIMIPTESDFAIGIDKNIDKCLYSKLNVYY
jgi:hypothetical protein